MFVPSIRLPLRIATIPDCSGTKPHDWRTLEAFGLTVMAAPTSCSNDDCSRIFLGFMSVTGVNIRVENVNRHFVACSAQTDSSTEAGDSGAYDDDVHGSG